MRNSRMNYLLPMNDDFVHVELTGILSGKRYNTGKRFKDWKL